MLTAAMTTLTKRCVLGIEANRERCLDLVRGSIGIVTALGPAIGYEAASRIAKRAPDEDRPVADLVLAEGLLTPAELDACLAIEAMTHPSRPKMAKPASEPRS